jgi:hypothetical protein
MKGRLEYTRARVLLVEAVSDEEEDENVYRRVGVAILERQHIALEEDGKEKTRVVWIK